MGVGQQNDGHGKNEPNNKKEKNRKMYNIFTFCKVYPLEICFMFLVSKNNYRNSKNNSETNKNLFRRFFFLGSNGDRRAKNTTNVGKRVRRDKR